MENNIDGILESESLETMLGWAKEIYGKEDRRSCTYVLLMSNGSVKIGRTKDFDRRRNTICNSSGLDVVREFHTEQLLHKTACEIELNCHKFFKDKRIRGEYFTVSFDDAVERVEALVRLAKTDAQLMEACKELEMLAIEQEMQIALESGSTITREDAAKRVAGFSKEKIAE